MTLEERREAILENVVVSGDKKWLRHTETADNITGDDENITATGETKASDKNINHSISVMTAILEANGDKYVDNFPISINPFEYNFSRLAEKQFFQNSGRTLDALSNEARVLNPANFMFGTFSNLTFISFTL